MDQLYQPESIHDGDKVARQARRHAFLHCVEDDIVDRDEHAQEEQKAARSDQSEWNLCKRDEELLHIKRFRAWWDAGFDRQIGDNL